MVVWYVMVEEVWYGMLWWRVGGIMRERVPCEQEADPSVPPVKLVAYMYWNTTWWRRHTQVSMLSPPFLFTRPPYHTVIPTANQTKPCPDHTQTILNHTISYHVVPMCHMCNRQTLSTISINYSFGAAFGVPAAFSLVSEGQYFQYPAFLLHSPTFLASSLSLCNTTTSRRTVPTTQPKLQWARTGTSLRHNLIHAHYHSISIHYHSISI